MSWRAAWLVATRIRGRPLRAACRTTLAGKSDDIDIRAASGGQDPYVHSTLRGRHQQENRQQEISEISRSLKALAKELNVPIMALSQLSRSVESRDDKRPMLSDLRESGSIEQDADVVMFVYREEYYLKSREPEIGSPEHSKWLEKCERAMGRAEVLVEKHRHGATRAIPLQFDDRFTRFSNLADEDNLPAH